MRPPTSARTRRFPCRRHCSRSPTQCDDFVDAPSTRNAFARLRICRSATLARSCWRRCSSQDSSMKTSTKSVGSSTSWTSCQKIRAVAPAHLRAPPASRRRIRCAGRSGSGTRSSPSPARRARESRRGLAAAVHRRREVEHLMIAELESPRERNGDDHSRRGRGKRCRESRSVWRPDPRRCCRAPCRP